MQDQLHVDVVVVGAGPAGSTVALNLAPFHKVLIVTKQGGLPQAVGESLPAAASRLLKDMGLWTSFIEQDHQPHRLSKSYWSSATPQLNDSIRNLDGDGWHLDRTRFDDWLLQQACRRGAGILQCDGLKTVNLDSSNQSWFLESEVNGQRTQIQAKWLVDATGRKSFIAKRMGLAQRSEDKLACGWVIGRQLENAAQESEIHAEKDGWWYTAILPNQRRLLAFYSDADQPSAKDAHSPTALLKRAQELSDLRQVLSGTEFYGVDSKHGFCSANSATLPQYAGHRWLATGDAAMCFDPLSSQGIFNALYTGLAASTSIHDALSSDHFQSSIDDYCSALGTIWQTYLKNRASWYQDQARWPQSEFWLRRKTLET